jgi:hypothetical protein
MPFPKYEIMEATEFTIAQIIRTDENGMVSAIPCHLDNADYREYLASLNEADEL